MPDCEAQKKEECPFDFYTDELIDVLCKACVHDDCGGDPPCDTFLWRNKDMTPIIPITMKELDRHLSTAANQEKVQDESKLYSFLYWLKVCLKAEGVAIFQLRDKTRPMLAEIV